MLKYKRISKENKITVTFNDRATLFTKDFITALILAIALHLSFISLFNIKDIGLLLAMRPSPLNFNVESVLLNNQISLDTGSIKIDDVILEPIYDGVALASLPFFIIERHFDETLQHLDQKIMALPFEERFATNKNNEKRKPIEVIFYHELAGKEVMHMAELEKIPQKGFAKFNVQVEDQSGRVIWSELKGSSGIKSVELLANRLLQTLCFKPVEDSFVTLGEVEIIFNGI